MTEYLIRAPLKLPDQPSDRPGWLVRLTQGWRLCGLAPEPLRGWAVMMVRRI